MKTLTARGDTNHKGGWAWLFLPFVVMFVGGNLVFGFFFASSGDIQVSARRTLGIGPILWSVLHLVLLVVALWRLRHAGCSARRILGYDRLRLPRDLLLSLGLGVVAAAVILTVQYLQQPFFESGALPWPRWVIVYWTVATSLTAGFGEEFYFRGFLFYRLGRLRTPLLLIATSMAFSIWHIAPNLLVHTFLVSLLFGTAYLRSGRLLPVALGHTLTNMLGGLGMLAGW